MIGASERQSILQGLERQFEGYIEVLYDELQRRQFHFPEQERVHVLHLDRELIARHALPYCITESTYFSLEPESVHFFAAVMLLHSLALTKIDDYYDGGYLSKPGVPATLNISSLAYSLSATHEAMLTLLRKSPSANELANLLNVTSFVHARMFKDFVERYNPTYLHPSPRRLDAYLHGQRSRLLGSGYWEVMTRASFVQRGKVFPEGLHKLDLKLRKLRQLVDEMCDVAEDLAGGLITLPVVHALTHHPRPGKIRSAIVEYWETGCMDPIQMQIFLDEAGTMRWMHRQGTAIYEAALTEIDRVLGRRGDGYRQLFEYKKSKLDMIAA